MSVESIICALEEKIHNTQGAIQQALAHYHGLLGILQATKEALSIALRITDIVAPHSDIADSLNVAQNVTDIIEDTLEGEPKS